MKTWAFTATFLLSATCMAVLSNPANIVDFKADSVCRIITTNEGTNSICTGALIKSDLVLTAAHCAVGPAAKVEVSCGYVGYDPANMITIKTGKGNTVIQNVAFKETAWGTFTFVDNNEDQSLIQLDRKLSLNTMPILNGNADVTRPCLLTGYGIGKSGTAGVLISAWVPSTIIQGSSYRFENTFVTTKTSATLMRVDEMAASAIESTIQGVTLLAGDSGGPFLCYNKQGQLVQVAVNNSIIRNSQEKSGQTYFSIASFAYRISDAIRKNLGL